MYAVPTALFKPLGKFMRVMLAVAAVVVASKAAQSYARPINASMRMDRPLLSAVGNTRTYRATTGVVK